MPDLPDCAWCSAAHTLQEDWAEMGTRFCHCSCCSQITRVDDRGIAHRVERRVTDVSGTVMHDP